MELTSLPKHPQLDQNTKAQSRYRSLSRLWTELLMLEFPEEVTQSLNRMVAPLKDTGISIKQWGKLVKIAQSRILRLLEKKQKLVPANYYRNLWMALGMSAFGLPMGVAIGAALGSMAFLGIGLPIGMAVGLAMGTSMDQKAKAEGRQLQWKGEVW